MTYDEFGYEKPSVAGEQVIQLLTPKKQKELLITGLRAALKDESAEYEHLAREAEAAGFPAVAKTLRGIAADERRHYELLDSMLRELEKESLASLSKGSMYHGGSYLRESERGRY